MSTQPNPIATIAPAPLGANLVYNGDFRYFSNAIGSTVNWDFGWPDGWVYADSGKGGKIGRDLQTGACDVYHGQGGQLCLTQALHEFPGWQRFLQGQDVAVSVFLTLKGQATLSLTDGATTDSFEWSCTSQSSLCRVDLHLAVDAAATSLRFVLNSTSDSTAISLVRVCGTVGTSADLDAPPIVQGVIGERRQYIGTEVAPLDELSLCGASLELDADQSRLDSVLNGRFGRGPNQRSLLPDVRGYFSRAWNAGADTDPDAGSRTPLGKSTIEGDHAGTVQADELVSHDHNYGTYQASSTAEAGGGPPTHVATQQSTQRYGGKETRGKNISELHTIKWA